MKATKTILCILITGIFVVPVTIGIETISQPLSNESDLDPLVNVEVTVEIQKIRSLEKEDLQVHAKEKIDRYSDPDFFVKIFINDVEFRSEVWRNTKYIYDLHWSATLDVPDDEEFVNITIQLWDWNLGLNKLCDISSDHDGYFDSYDIELIYSIKSGHWWGDDFTSTEPTEADISGYGRLNGCDDGSIYQKSRDCELWFDVYQTDPDGDGIPYWTEINAYGTDPELDNTGEDADHDGVPIEWEHKWGHYYHDWYDEHYWVYDPFVYNNHSTLDPDQDGLDNVEEYMTSQWDSDPFRKDLFIELDQMEEGPNGEKISILPEGSKELLRTAYDRQNVVYHLDDGCMGGSDMIPFDTLSSHNELQEIYLDYFLHGDSNNWRRGVFHLGLVIYQAEINGFVFWGGVGPYLDAYQISANGMETKTIPKIQSKRDEVYASAYMHECGHTLGIFHGNTPGCDDQEGKYPWKLNWWKWRPYVSVMNYGYMYMMVDYSDGSRGRNDFDDWDRIDLTFFQRDRW